MAAAPAHRNQCRQLASWLIPALAAVPDLQFELVVDDQDWSAEWLERGEVSAAVTASDVAVAGCTRYPLGALRYIATASPAFEDGLQTGSRRKRPPPLAFNARDGLQRSWMTAKADRAHATHPLSALDHASWTQPADRLGLNPEALVRGPVRNGRLVALDPNLPLDVPLDWQVSRVLAPALEPVSAAIRKAAKAGLLQVEA